MHVYEVRPRKDHRGIDLISDALPFGRLWYTQVSDAVDYAQFYSRSHDTVIRVYDCAGNVIATHESAGPSRHEMQMERLAMRGECYPAHSSSFATFIRSH